MRRMRSIDGPPARDLPTVAAISLVAAVALSVACYAFLFVLGQGPLGELAARLRLEERGVRPSYAAEAVFAVTFLAPVVVAWWRQRWREARSS